MVRSSTARMVESWYDSGLRLTSQDSDYIAEQKAKMQSQPLAFSFDFSGKASASPVVRGQDGLNEQGYKAPAPAAEQGFPLALIPASLLIVALTVYVQTSS